MGKRYTTDEYNNFTNHQKQKVHTVDGGYYFGKQKVTRYPPGKVNGVTISKDATAKIIAAWREISARVKAAKEAADRARATLEANEKQWALVEELMNMRRDKTGALVPKNNHQNCCTPYEPQCSCVCSDCKPRAGRKPRVLSDKKGSQNG